MLKDWLPQDDNLIAKLTLEREFKILNQRQVARVETNSGEVGIEKIVVQSSQSKYLTRNSRVLRFWQNGRMES
jgi:hypothetical protein